MLSLFRFLKACLIGYGIIVILNFGYSQFPEHYIDPELREFSNETINLIDLKCENRKHYFYPSHTTITFEKLDPGLAGLCVKNYFKWNIKIDKIVWNELTENERHVLIRHELSHCMLGQSHLDDPKGHYMNPVISDIKEDIQLKQFLDVIKDKCNG